MEDAQASANSEEKSSAGDKYETGRAMNHLEKDMHAKQLISHKKDLAALHAVDCNIVDDAVKPGCFVRCNGASFFIAAGLGKLVVDKEIIYLLSPNAPLAILMQHKKAGDSFEFMKKELLIEEVF